MGGIAGSKRDAANMTRSLLSIRKPGAFDRCAGVAGGVTAARDLRPQAAVVDGLEQQAPGLAARDDVLVEAQFAGGAQHAAQLGERPVLVGDGAQDQARDDAIGACIFERQIVGDARHHAYGNRSVVGGALGGGAQRRLGLEGDDLGEAVRMYARAKRGRSRLAVLVIWRLRSTSSSPASAKTTRL
jgi:hypothetical protein